MRLNVPRAFPILIAGFGSLLATPSQAAVLHTAAEVSRSLCAKPPQEAEFAVTATVTAIVRYNEGTQSPDRSALGLEDASGATVMETYDTPLPDVSTGDLVRVTGTIAARHLNRAPAAILRSLSVIGRGLPVQPKPATFRSIQSGSLDFHLARVSGTVRDASTSDSSASWVILKLVSDENLLDISVFHPLPDSSDLQSLIGARVRITGIVTPFDYSLRANMGRIFWCWSERDIEVVDRPPVHQPAAPDISALSGLHPSIILRCGRHRAVGTVLATWHGDRLLMRTTSGDICRVDIANVGELPSAGDWIEAIGFPESDLYHINLMRATWGKAGGGRPKHMPSQPSQASSRPRNMPDFIDMLHYGEIVQVTGTVQGLPDGNEGVMYIQTERTTLPIDISSTPQLAKDLAIGCVIRATGIYVIDTPNWTPNALCQKLDNFSVVIRTPADVVVLKRPSWWTVRRLLVTGGILLAIVITVLVWNRFLVVLIERRGRELLREQIGHIRAKLKIDERTRLAIDLHDALSQSLTGISLQIDLVTRMADPSDQRISRHLDIASRTLQSCRSELRGCIYDLRNQALDEPSLEGAIRMTLRPHLDATRLALRFPVPRRKLDDNTAHTLLRIIRELVSNALRHGAASAVRIAGTIDGGWLHVSVQDNGSGFDPETRPRSADGHFGLDGIRERLRHFGGAIEIKSSRGSGTKVMFSLCLPEHEKKEGANPYD